MRTWVHSVSGTKASGLEEAEETPDSCNERNRATTRTEEPPCLWRDLLRKRENLESAACHWLGSVEPRNSREAYGFDAEEAAVALENVAGSGRALRRVAQMVHPVALGPGPPPELPGKRGGLLETRGLDVGDGNECPFGHAVAVGCGDGVMYADHEARVRNWW